MKLADLLTEDAVSDARFAALELGGIGADSRTVKPGDLFVAVAGSKDDGLQFVAPAVATTWAAIAAAAPEFVIVAPCGYHLPGAIEQAHAVARALPGIPVWAIDADGIVVRPGPRLIDGVEAIASILHSEAVPAARPPNVHQVTAFS